MISENKIPLPKYSFWPRPLKPVSFEAQVLSDLPENEVRTNEGSEEATYFSTEEPEEEYNSVKGIQDLDG